MLGTLPVLTDTFDKSAVGVYLLQICVVLKDLGLGAMHNLGGEVLA